MFNSGSQLPPPQSIKASDSANQSFDSAAPNYDAMLLHYQNYQPWIGKDTAKKYCLETSQQFILAQDIFEQKLPNYSNQIIHLQRFVASLDTLIENETDPKMLSLYQTLKENHVLDQKLDEMKIEQQKFETQHDLLAKQHFILKQKYNTTM